MMATARTPAMPATPATPAMLVPLMRYAGHWRGVGPWLVLGNLAVVAVVVGVHTLLESSSLGLELRVAATVAAPLLVLGLVLVLVRRRRGAVVHALELSADRLTLRPLRGRARTYPRSDVTVRRLAYLTHEGGIGHAHLPVLELRPRGRAPLRIACESASAWPRPDATLLAAPPFVVDANGWSIVCTLG